MSAQSNILRDLDRAEQLRADAIRRLAQLRSRADSGFLFDDDLRELLYHRCPRLEACHGYRGHAVGWKYQDGFATATPSITLFVRRKLSRRQLERARGLPVPRWLRTARGARMQTDVVEFGCGAKDRSPIRPGALIGPSGRDNPGMLTCFAWTKNRQLVGLTAGHVADGAAQYVAPPGSSVVFGFLDEKSLRPVDAATILISAPIAQVMPNGSLMQGYRKLTQQDVGATVFLFRAGSGTWSAGTIKSLAPWISNWGVADAIVYSAPSSRGDSGGPVIDQYGYLVGLHLGRGTYEGQDVALAHSIARVATELNITPTFNF